MFRSAVYVTIRSALGPCVSNASCTDVSKTNDTIWLNKGRRKNQLTPKYDNINDLYCVCVCILFDDEQCFHHGVTVKF
jgi:hypothetical protein